MANFSHWKDFLQEPDEYPESIKPRKGRKGSQGLKTGLPINRWLALVFEWNEVRAMQASISNVKPLSDDQILYNFKLEFGTKRKKDFGGSKQRVGGGLLSGTHSIGWYRNKFRKGIIYPNQTKPLLMPFRYSNEGNLCKDRTKANFQTFRECQQLCIDYKIADPRFFTPEELERLHQYSVQDGVLSDWRFPHIEELKDLRDAVPVTIYRSVLTYDLWKEEKEKKVVNTPSGDPVDKVREQSKKKAKQNEEELEKQRQATKRLISSIEIDEDLQEGPEHEYGWGSIGENE